MSDTNNNQNNQQNTNRTFTQDELNAIVQTRLADERKKYADYDSLKEKAGKYDAQEEANKSELQKANEKAADLQAKLDAMTKATALQDIKAKVSKETGVPVELLSGSDEATCKAQADAILKFAKPKSYPGAKKNTGTKGGSDNSDNAEWADFAESLFGRKE